MHTQTSAIWNAACFTDFLDDSEEAQMLFFFSLSIISRFVYNMLSKLFGDALNSAHNRTIHPWCFMMVVGWWSLRKNHQAGTAIFLRNDIICNIFVFLLPLIVTLRYRTRHARKQVQLKCTRPVFTSQNLALLRKYFRNSSCFLCVYGNVENLTTFSSKQNQKLWVLQNFFLDKL